MYKNETRYALINGVLLDGTRDMTPQTGKIVCVEGGKIAAVTDGPVPAGYEPVDLAGRYVLPGLINLHVHLPASGKPKKKPSDPKKLVKLITSNGLMRRVGVKLCESYARTELLSGVTTIRTVGGVADFDTIIRDRAAAGEILSPRVVASNMAVSVPGGHMAGSLAYEARTPEEAAAYVERIAAEKPDLIKLMITGGVMDAEVVGEPGVLRMEPALVKAACDRAHGLGMKVAAHVESPEGVRVALENGVDSIEHGAKPDEDILRLLKEHGAFQVATLSPAIPYALFDRSVSHATYEQQENGKVVLEGVIAMARACLENDIPVGLGTDTGCPYVTHYDMWRELCYFVKYCGVTPAFALHSATLLNARLAGIDSVTGSVEAGKAADLIVCDRDPLADLSALRSLHMVIKDGVRIEHPAVKKLPEVERELDKFL
ncbi:MAG: amidohydrolase family protein [Oscillospiraceae bacterium]|jgi:imidazolonepropionase-like amidohydrolase|nr:amidohydrolase family protein [Oscillospiraceae bacterium]